MSRSTQSRPCFSGARAAPRRARARSCLWATTRSGAQGCVRRARRQRARRRFRAQARRGGRPGHCAPVPPPRHLVQGFFNCDIYWSSGPSTVQIVDGATTGFRPTSNVWHHTVSAAARRFDATPVTRSPCSALHAQRRARRQRLRALVTRAVHARRSRICPALALSAYTLPRPLATATSLSIPRQTSGCR